MSNITIEVRSVFVVNTDSEVEAAQIVDKYMDSVGGLVPQTVEWLSYTMHVIDVERNENSTVVNVQHRQLQ